jgi:asparagine synthase (glutamine-hydrolysing)
MCGILGYLGKRDFDVEAFGRVLDLMRNRGPDDRGICYEPEVLLGHRRLSIIDVSLGGHQPMGSGNGRYQIVYNGEVYNYVALRAELESKGVAFRSRSDTEVILELYLREGPECLKRFRGMFAIAIWDRVERRLFLARDRMGIKPLYVWRFPGGIAFASQVKALRALPGGPREINPEAVVQYLLWGSVPCPITILKGVESLEPATWMTWRPCGDETKQRYWTFPEGPPIYRTRGEALEALRPKLIEAVALRCIADVPLGAFLSGGVDSSAIVCLMREAGQKDIRTFSVSFPQTDLDEGPYAVKVAEQYETLHENISVTEGMVRAELDNFFAAMDQPTCDGLNTFMVSKFARQGGLTVSLSGLGGDELFGGYPSFRRAVRLVPFISLFPRLAIWIGVRAGAQLGERYRKLEGLALKGQSVDRLYYLSRGLFTPSQIRSLVSPDLLNAAGPPEETVLSGLPESGNGSPFGATQVLELRRYMHNQLLRDSDVFGLDNSLEIRVPFIDHEIVEAVRQSASDVLLEGTPKALLMDALPQALPRLCTHRRKMGFTFPFDVWMRGPWGQVTKRLLVEQVNASDDAIFRAEGIRNVWAQYQKGCLHWSRPWCLLALVRMWH